MTRTFRSRSVCSTQALPGLAFPLSAPNLLPLRPSVTYSPSILPVILILYPPGFKNPGCGRGLQTHWPLPPLVPRILLSNSSHGYHTSPLPPPRSPLCCLAQPQARAEPQGQGQGSMRKGRHKKSGGPSCPVPSKAQLLGSGRASRSVLPDASMTQEACGTAPADALILDVASLQSWDRCWWFQSVCSTFVTAT